jgi:hypothetical protein
MLGITLIHQSDERPQKKTGSGAKALIEDQPHRLWQALAWQSGGILGG